MKTIEEAARKSNPYKVTESIGNALSYNNGFADGAKFVEQFISVEEEPLPKDCVFLSISDENYNEVSLVKWNESLQKFNVIANGIHLSDYTPTLITHWRPLNRK